MKLFAVFVIVILSFLNASWAAEMLCFQPDKAEIPALWKPTTVVIVGNPGVAAVSVDRPTMYSVVGSPTGGMPPFVSDDQGDVIADDDPAVSAVFSRHVATVGATDLLTPFNCNPRWSQVEDRWDNARPRHFAHHAKDDWDAYNVGRPLPAAMRGSGNHSSGISEG